jgi:hypothetical protein
VRRDALEPVSATVSNTNIGLPAGETRKEPKMLWTITVILVILWLLGFVSSYTMGGLIHILLVVAIIVVLVRVIQGRRWEAKCFNQAGDL